MPWEKPAEPVSVFIKPQLAKLVSRPPAGTGWLHEIKFDGYRLQVHVRGERVKIYTRSGQDWTEKFPGIAEEFASFRISSCIVDGEAVVMDKDGRSDFQRLQNALSLGDAEKAVFYAFDLLSLVGKDLREVPLIKRKEALEAMVRRRGRGTVLYSEHVQASGRDFLENACRSKLEGIVSKRADSAYTSGRAGSWLKSKCGLRQEFVIGGFTAPKKSRSHFGALLLGVYEKGALRYVGKVGSGFDEENLKALHRVLMKQEIRESPFKKMSPCGAGIHWVRPNFVAEVAFSRWTRDGLLRIPIFRGLREDKNARLIVREEAVEPPMERHEERKRPLAGFSHPRKLLFPESGFSKKALGEYYLAVAPLLLPHLAGRPLSLLRCPDGIKGKCFFQKRLHENPPDGVELRGFGHDGFLTVENVQGLLSLVQRDVVEFHAQNRRAPAPTRPDQIVIDFDPAEDLPWSRVRGSVLDFKKILDRLGLKGFLKTSGGKGFHVHIPIAPLYEEADVKAFARALAVAMATLYPRFYTTKESKDARKGKIFVDYLRNTHGATAVAPYSVRARAGAPVAMPIHWRELKKLESSAAFSVTDVLSLLKRRKHDPWEGYFALKQKLPFLRTTRSRHTERVGLS